MFPDDEYTPHGYLDNPAHSWALHPSGVLRSLAPIGMGWHVPNYGSYGRNQFRYSAHLLAGLRLGGRVFFTKEDFASQGITVSSNHHSKNIFNRGFQVAQGRLTLEFQVARDKAQSMLLTFQGLRDAASLSIVQVSTPEVPRAITCLTSLKARAMTARYLVSLSMVKSVLIRLHAPA
jgi:hypothetical protein